MGLTLTPYTILITGTSEKLQAVDGREARESHCCGGAQYLHKGVDWHEISPEKRGAAHPAHVRGEGVPFCM